MAVQWLLKQRVRWLRTVQDRVGVLGRSLCTDCQSLAQTVNHWKGTSSFPICTGCLSTSRQAYLTASLKDARLSRPRATTRAKIKIPQSNPLVPLMSLAKIRSLFKSYTSLNTELITQHLYKDQQVIWIWDHQLLAVRSQVSRST